MYNEKMVAVPKNSNLQLRKDILVLANAILILRETGLQTGLDLPEGLLKVVRRLSEGE